MDILGKRGEPGVDTLTIIHEYGLPGDFPEGALEDARQQATRFDESIAEGRRDLTDWTVVTIDGKRSAHFEHTVAITPDGPRILTAA